MKLSVAFKITAIYVIVGSLWILLSDQWVAHLTSETILATGGGLDKITKQNLEAAGAKIELK